MGNLGELAEQPAAAAVVPTEAACTANAELAGKLPVDLPPESGSLVHEQASKARPGRLDGRGDARRAAADDDQRPAGRPAGWRAAATLSPSNAGTRAPSTTNYTRGPLPIAPVSRRSLTGVTRHLQCLHRRLVSSRAGCLSSMSWSTPQRSLRPNGHFE